MARGGSPGDDKVVSLRPGLVATGGGGPHDPSVEARVARVEAAVEHLQSDLTEVRTTLGRIEFRLYLMAGEMPHLATKAELEKRPTTAKIIAVVALIAAIASVPIWPEWAATIRTLAAATH